MTEPRRTRTALMEYRLRRFRRRRLLAAMARLDQPWPDRGGRLLPPGRR